MARKVQLFCTLNYRSTVADTQPSNCQLIEPQQQVDLHTGHCLNLIDTVNPQSTQPSNAGTVSPSPG